MTHRFIELKAKAKAIEKAWFMFAFSCKKRKGAIELVANSIDP